MQETTVSEITIIPIKPKNGLVALASCVLDNKFYFGSIGIYTKLAGGYRLTYPTKKVGTHSINIYHPINKEAGDAVEAAIISKYEELTADSVEHQPEEDVK